MSKACCEHESAAIPMAVAETVFSIDGMDCPTEESLIRKRLESLPGVEGLEFDLINQKLTVAHRQVDRESLVREISAVGMTAIPESEQASSVPGMTRTLLEQKRPA